MKPLRILSAMLIVLSIGFTFLFYNYQRFDRLSSQRLGAVNAKLAQSREELVSLNNAIASLQKANLRYRQQLQELEKEKRTLSLKVAMLIGEKNALEQTFHSLKELKRAIKIAKREKSLENKVSRIKMRLAKMAILESMDEAALQQGNRGYLLRQKSPTFRAKIRVELEPVANLSSRE